MEQHPYDGPWTECRRAELLKTSTFSPTRGFAEGTSLSLENVENADGTKTSRQTGTATVAANFQTGHTFQTEFNCLGISNNPMVNKL